MNDLESLTYVWSERKCEGHVGSKPDNHGHREALRRTEF